MGKFKTISLKILKWTGITVLAVLFLLFILPILFPGTISRQVKIFANKHLQGELDYRKTTLSFFRHFPSLTVSVDDFLLKGSKPFTKDTLLYAGEVAVGINLPSLVFRGEVKIDEIYANDAYASIFVNSKGQPNYNVFVPNPEKDSAESASIKLDLIKLRNWHIKYNDHSAKVHVNAKNLDYTGRGGLSESIFDLETDLDIEKIDFTLDGINYARQKTVHADLVTRINTDALTFVLRKNELKINELPLKFNGDLSILKDGYKININAASENSTLKDLISVLPPEYVDWADNLKINGKSDLYFSLAGEFNEQKKLKPDLKARLSVNDGYLSTSDTPIPLDKLNLSLNLDLPSLDTEKMTVGLRNFEFDLGDNNNFSARAKTEGLTQMKVEAKIKGVLNLETLDDALGLDFVDMKGIVKTDILANGIFSYDKKLFPETDGLIQLKNGWLKTKYYPNPIRKIHIDTKVHNNDGTFKSLGVTMKPFTFEFEGNPVFVSAELHNFQDIVYKIRAAGVLNVGKIYRVFAQEGFDLSGTVVANLSLDGKQSDAASGQYGKLNNHGTLNLKNIKATTEFLPKSFLIKEGNFEFENEKMWFRKFNSTYGKSNFTLNGHLLNTIHYFLEKNGTLHGNFQLNSNYVLVDEFMALESGDNGDKALEVEYAKIENPKSSGVVIVPKDLDISLNTNIKKVEFKGLELNDLMGEAAMKNGNIYLSNTHFDIVGSRMAIEARYADESPLAANFNVAIRVKDFSVQRAYKEIEMFREMVTAAKDASGIINIDYKLKGDFDQNMKPIYPSLEGGGVINLKDVQVKNLKMFAVLGRETGADDFNNPDMKGVNIETHIDNNVIHIDKFTFKVSVLRPSIKGTTSFNGLLDLRVRIGLPPGGWIGFPIVVTGTHEKPKIKIFSKTGQEIKEAVYNEKTNQVVDNEKRKPRKEK